MKASAREASRQELAGTRIFFKNNGRLINIPGAPNAVLQNTRCPKCCAPIAGAPKVSAPNAWVPLLLCPKVQCSYGCAPNAVHLVPASQLASYKD